MNISTQIGKQIKFYRKKMKLTQEELAVKSSLSRNAIYNYENGKRSPDIKTLNKIANALGVTINDLAKEKDTITKKVLKQLISDGTSLEQISNDTKISISRLNLLLKNTNDVTYDEIKKIAKCIDCTDEQIAQWIASDTFTTVIYNNKDKNNYQAELLKKFFLDDKVSKKDLLLALADGDEDTINYFYPYINNKAKPVSFKEMKNTVDKISPLFDSEIKFLCNKNLEKIFNYSFNELAKHGYENLLIVAIENAIKQTLVDIKVHLKDGDIFDGIGSWISKDSPAYNVVKNYLEKETQKDESNDASPHE